MAARWRVGPGRHVLLLVAAALTVTGGIAVGWAATHQQVAPQPSAAAAGVVDSTEHLAQSAAPLHPEPSSDPSSRVGSDAAAPSDGPLLPRSIPTAIRIPAIGVRSALQSLGLGSDGALAVPAPGPRYNQAAWYIGSPTPGELGPAIIEGHIDSAASGPSVFFRLGALVPGDRVYVDRADGLTATFVVNAVRSYPKDRFPTTIVYGNTEHAALRLLTCGGSFDRATGHYRDNTVVFAHLVSG